MAVVWITRKYTYSDGHITINLIVVMILWMLLLDADYDELPTTITTKDIIVVSSGPPNVGTDGKFTLTTSIINNSVVYLLRKEVDGGYQDFITNNNVILKYDAELSTTGIYRVISECYHYQLYTKIPGMRFNHDTKTNCRIIKHELIVPKGYISLGLNPI